MEIPEPTRRQIVDALRVSGARWSGELSEPEFLGRLYDLSGLPSYDHRFTDAAGDIWKHRVVNDDWGDFWVFSDPRFDLLSGPDEPFLRFLCEMLHPAVRSDSEEVHLLLTLFNEGLVADGWQLIEARSIAERPVFTARRLTFGATGLEILLRQARASLPSDYVHQQITRMEGAIQSDPDLAIGTAKELVETVCKTVLEQRGATINASLDFPSLVRRTLKALELAPQNIPDQVKASETIRVLLHNLASVSAKLAELRNAYGTGHGRTGVSRGLGPRHARLAVGAATTLAVFVLETHEDRGPTASTTADERR